MNVSFETNKECNSYKAFVENPTDRKALRDFRKVYNDLDNEALKLHDRIKASPNAKAYNTLNSGNNSIQKVTGIHDNTPLCLKVRVNRAYRKFFHYVCDVDRHDYLLTKNWTGNFEAITDIHVTDINKHDYSAF